MSDAFPEYLAQSEGESGKLQPPPTPQQQIWQLVTMIPRGKVATYGQVAALIGLPSHARLVGRTLRELPRGTKIPWHRVINASMRISQRKGSAGHLLQRQRLEDEGVEFIGERVTRGCRWETALND